jgi:hypothetical protein
MASGGAATGSTWPAMPTHRAFKADETRPNVWRYRDYVIDAFNRDLPYDRFIRQQIAGDELFPNDRRQRLPPGSIACGPTRATLPIRS